ncbi:MAG: J domain-containing protein [Bacteriovoracaceae bacterium]|nr:J domain-containing protein [Bacteriovoracaceae bacterium]
MSTGLFFIIPVSFFIAMFIAYVVLHKTGRRNGQRSEDSWNKGFNRLVRQKLMEFGLFDRWYEINRDKRKNDSGAAGKCKTLKILEESLARRPDNQKILKSYRFLQSVNEGSLKYLRAIGDALEKVTGCNVSAQFILSDAKKLLNLEVFLVSEAKLEILPFQEIGRIIKSYVLVDLFIEDAIRGSSTVTRMIERMRGVSGKRIYKAVEFLVLLKSGASQKFLLDEIVFRANEDLSRLAKIGEIKKHTAIMSIIRKPNFTFRGPQEVIDEVIAILRKINKLGNEHLNKIHEERRKRDEERRRRDEENRKQKYEKARQRQKEQSKKQQQKEREQKKGGINIGGVQLDDAYEILGCDINCSIRRIKKRYKGLAMEKHPDRISDANDKKMAHEEFIRIKNAYEKIMKTKKAA